MRKYKLTDVKTNDKDASNLEELESLSIFDKGFEDFLDTLENNNQIELAMRDELY